MTTEPRFATAYRDADDALRARRAELILARRAEAADAPPPVAAQVYGRRVARAAAAVPMISCVLALPVIALWRFVSTNDWETGGVLTAVLLAAWPLALLTYVGARVAAARVFAARVRAAIAPTDDLHGDVARLEQRRAEGFAADVADALEKRSIGLPLAGLAAVMPLTIHFLVWLVMRAVEANTDPITTFDRWIEISMVLVTHCHVLLALLGWRYAKKLRGWPARIAPVREGWLAWLWTWAAAAVPGAILLLIPVGIVFLTGILFVPLSFWCFGRIALRERTELAVLQAATRS